MRLPIRLPEHQPVQRLLMACAIAVACAGVGVLLAGPWGILAPLRKLDDVFYDSLFTLRTPEPKLGADVVIVAVDDQSIEAVDAVTRFGWPWPREYWGHLVTYLKASGAKAVAFDLLFDRSSVYNNASDDDAQFAAAIDAARDGGLPVVFATRTRPDGSLWDFAPPAKHPLLGVANVVREDVVRTYDPAPVGRASLASVTVDKAGVATPEWAKRPFLLHYYGPHDKDGTPATFSYVRAASVLAAAIGKQKLSTAAQTGVSPEMFRGKIVLIATITAATYDLKSSPTSVKYPGVEIHATAIQNMIEGRRVIPVAAGWPIALGVFGCLVGAVMTVVPRRAPGKVLGGLAGPAIVLGVCGWLFMGGREIRWLAPAAPLTATVIAAFVAMAYSYLTELRHRQFILKALAQSVSQEVADAIARDPKKLELGGDRREMTVMFTDLANFTTLSERIEVERLADTLHYYLEEMSGVVFGENGTLDKYIGDAIMAFWNAPLDQGDHAVRACRTALEMRRREAVIQPAIREMAGTEVYSRIGINSGPMVVGNMGSSYKFSYTVLGDSVNLAARLEGANKMYGTRIMLSETTAAIVRDKFTMRKLDLLRVKGKLKPMGVYELIAEGAVDETTAELIRRYEAALAAYQAGKFDEARSELEAMLESHPDDGPTMVLLKRVRTLIEDPPEAWDGVYVAKEK